MYFSNNAKLGDFLIQQDYFDAGDDILKCVHIIN